MFIIIHLIYLLLNLAYIFAIDPGIIDHQSVVTTEAFLIPISRAWFSEFSRDDSLEYSMSLENMPDLPRWMYSRLKNNSDAFLYGSPEEPGSLKIEIIAMNTNTYETAIRVLQLNVEPRHNLFEHEVEMKFSNLDVEDMFRSDRLKRLIEIFRSSLWKDNEDVYVTKVISSIDAGGRKPLDPKMKEGVVVRIGGVHPFSRDLEDLEREVRPLRNRYPCPRDYKRTSAEHLFRGKNFIADWCSFRLLSNKERRMSGSGNDLMDEQKPKFSFENENYEPQMTDIPRRNLAIDFITSIILPTVIVIVISTVFTCLLCFSKDDPTDQMANLHVTQYNTAQNSQQATNAVPHSDSMTNSSFPDSRTESPASTLVKGFTMRGGNRSGTLRNAQDPPPYSTNTGTTYPVGILRNNQNQ